MRKGFTLIELLISFLLLSVLAVIALVAINPLEQTRRAKDSANLQNATNFLNAISRYQAIEEKNPLVLASANTIDCEDIVTAGPVYDFNSLRNELSDWFSGIITNQGAELYVGIQENGYSRVCFRVGAVANTRKVSEMGCTVLPYSYLCLPE